MVSSNVLVLGSTMEAWSHGFRVRHSRMSTRSVKHKVQSMLFSGGSSGWIDSLRFGYRYPIVQESIVAPWNNKFVECREVDALNPTSSPFVLLSSLFLVLQLEFIS